MTRIEKELKQARKEGKTTGRIMTTSTGFMVYKRTADSCREASYKQYEISAKAGAHVDTVKRIAKDCFGTGRLIKSNACCN